MNSVIREQLLNDTKDNDVVNQRLEHYDTLGKLPLYWKKDGQEMELSDVAINLMMGEKYGLVMLVAKYGDDYYVVDGVQEGDYYELRTTDGEFYFKYRGLGEIVSRMEQYIKAREERRVTNFDPKM